ncbi:MAG: Gfo/Idh/MocA family oxidoreductase [Candidatus Nanopelagicales bacterium]
MAIRVGIIGYGLAGRLFHAPFIACTPGLDLTHVVSRDPSRAAQAVQEQPGVQVVPDVEALLAADVDLVVVASPSGLHARHAQAACSRGGTSCWTSRAVGWT